MDSQDPKGFRDLTPDLADANVEQLTRILRTSQALGLDGGIATLMTQKILSEFTKLDHQDEGSLSPREWEVKNCELKIRQVINAGGDWSQLKAYAWKRFRLIGTASAATQLVESVFISGTIHEAADVLAALNSEGYDYYFGLEPRFREHLVYKLIKVQKTETLRIFLLDEAVETDLVPIEKLFVFMSKAKSKNEADAFMYFRRHETNLVEAVSKFGPGLNLTLARFYFDQAEAAMAAGFIDVAKRLLKQITPDQDEYSDALEIMMVLEHDRNNPASETYFKKLEKAESWRDRIGLINSYVDDVRSRRGKEDIRRPAVNEILSEPFKWVPELPNAITDILTVIAQNADLFDVLPSMLNTWREHALRFHSPAIESAIWLPVRKEMRGGHTITDFWRAVASLHLYLAGSLQDDIELWKAKQVIEQADQTFAFAIPYKWRDLHDAAIKHMSKATHVKESERQNLMAHLRLCADSQNVNLQDVEHYLKVAVKPSYDILQRIEGAVSKQNAKILEKRLLLRRASISHFTNQDLDRLWRISCFLNDFDLAWRVASVLEGRKALADFVMQPWMISGEHRSQYPYYRPHREQLTACFAGFDRDERRLAQACLQVGHAVPALLALLDSNAKQVKVDAPPSDSFEAGIENALNQLKFLPVVKKAYRFGFDGLLSANMHLPDFIQVAPNNVWSYLFLRIGERMGVNTWMWKLSYLQESIEGLIPRVTHVSSMDSSSSKVAKWLRSLTPEQRSSWSDLTLMQSRMSDDRAAMVIAKFIGRLAIVIHPSHCQALKSLRVMRAPVELIWDLEAWILSDDYSQLRLDFQSICRVAVPVNLRNAPTIVR